MKSPLLVLLLLLCSFSFKAQAQHATGSMGNSVLGLIAANQFSKEESLYRARGYVMSQILGGSTEKPITFNAYALAAATSGELTTVVYSCPEKQKEGLLMSFYGLRENEQGVRYQSYAFKDLPKAKADEMLDKLMGLMKSSRERLHGMSADENVYFQYDDLTFLITGPGMPDPGIRVFWGQFDSEWNNGAVVKTKNRMGKRI